ncbi:hypothetical protein KFE25_012452 [Diacronema lutheri]|uniref:Uncharacterized protein n=2 Tax=Diacronema lutheri TaxID=2081491 RepID=A0A8J5XL60_DIALT|nr:hypothetical protein KFE25_012452 [Diacronema lutheri]
MPPWSACLYQAGADSLQYLVLALAFAIVTALFTGRRAETVGALHRAASVAWREFAKLALVLSARVSCSAGSIGCAKLRLIVTVDFTLAGSISDWNHKSATGRANIAALEAMFADNLLIARNLVRVRTVIAASVRVSLDVLQPYTAADFPPEGVAALVGAKLPLLSAALSTSGSFALESSFRVSEAQPLIGYNCLCPSGTGFAPKRQFPPVLFDGSTVARNWTCSAAILHLQTIGDGDRTYPNGCSAFRDELSRTTGETALKELLEYFLTSHCCAPDEPDAGCAVCDSGIARDGGTVVPERYRTSQEGLRTCFDVQGRGYANLARAGAFRERSDDVGCGSLRSAWDSPSNRAVTHVERLVLERRCCVPPEAPRDDDDESDSIAEVTAEIARQLPLGTVIGIAIGCVLLVLCCATAAYVLLLRRAPGAQRWLSYPKVRAFQPVSAGSSRAQLEARAPTACGAAEGGGPAQQAPRLRFWQRGPLLGTRGSAALVAPNREAQPQPPQPAAGVGSAEERAVVAEVEHGAAASSAASGNSASGERPPRPPPGPITIVRRGSNPQLEPLAQPPAPPFEAALGTAARAQPTAAAAAETRVVSIAQGSSGAMQRGASGPFAPQPPSGPPPSTCARTASSQRLGIVPAVDIAPPTRGSPTAAVARPAPPAPRAPNAAQPRPPAQAGAGSASRPFFGFASRAFRGVAIGAPTAPSACQAAAASSAAFDQPAGAGDAQILLPAQRPRPQGGVAPRADGASASEDAGLEA